MRHLKWVAALACAVAVAVPAASAAPAKKPPADASAVAIVDTNVVAAGTNVAAAPAVPAGADVETSGAAPDASTASPGVVPDSVDSTASSGCWYGFTVQRYATNIFGSKLWAYFQRIDWCGDGYYVTWHQRYRWGETYWPGWSFKGHIGNSVSGGNWYHWYTAWTQGHFCLISYLSCVQDRYPWVSMTVYGGGGYTWSTGG
jgi:hypothetical protein